MRSSDFQLNASQILTAAGLPKSQRDLYVRKLKSQGIPNPPTTGRSEFWVPFRDGVFLCQKVGLEKELKSLFSYAPHAKPDRKDNYFFEIKYLHWSGQTIAYRPSEGTINAAHLLRLGGTRRQLDQFFAKNPGIKRRVHLGKDRGTYVSYEEARALCLYLKLNPHPIEYLMASGYDMDSRPQDSMVEGMLGDTPIKNSIGSMENGISGCDLVPLQPVSIPDWHPWDPFNRESGIEDDRADIKSNDTAGKDTEGEAVETDSAPVVDGFDAYATRHERMASAQFSIRGPSLDGKDAPNGPNTDRYSQITEPSYRNGSYLIPAKQSFMLT
ncbi:hypothetical protein CDD83_4162 [Cordyceps sp. RAO-2017]|nr:hypothetical protein CDD83_4162 [Cordyceps sp. RAO-2017]